jgi:predicted dinucleotide-binding enzyme
MKVGILGTGQVARALGIGFVGAGHPVRFGTRDPHSDKASELVAAVGPAASIGTFADAAQFAEVAVLATAWSGTEQVIRAAGPDRLAGKVVVDVTNPLDFSKGAPPSLALGYTDSGGEQVQRWLPAARVVKAFNIVGNASMVRPQFPGGPPDMFICGDDEAAKRTVTDVCTAFGWPVIDLGGMAAARYLEPLAMVWIAYGFRTNTWTHAFKLLRK